MSARVITGAVILLLAAAWAAWPYGQLRSFGQAVDDGDAARLERAVDWESVHSHLTKDVKQRLREELDQEEKAGEPVEALARSALMLLGSAIAEGLIAAYATPETLLAVLSGIAEAGEGEGKFLDAVSYAFFAAPTRFRVHVKPEGSQGEPLALTFSFQDFGWVVTRIELPLDELGEANETGEGVQPERGPRNQER